MLLTIMTYQYCICIPTLAAARLQRWALILSVYMYEIRFRCTEEHANADCLPLNSSPGPEQSVEATCFNLGQVHAHPITAAKLSECSWQGFFGELCDAVYMQRLACHSSYRAEAVSHSMPRADCRGSVFALGNSDCGSSKSAAAALGIVASQPWRGGGEKSLARSVMWWPRMDTDIEALAKACTSCQAVKSAPSQAPLHPWRWPEFPWQ